jgi:ubiquitin-conjugating enzyme E2 variant
VNWFQKARILQTPRHHAQHHRGAKNTHYCVITNVLNPALDRIGFWRGLEWCIERTAGVKRRVEPT